jgi:hypothetical protein
VREAITRCQLPKIEKHIIGPSVPNIGVIVDENVLSPTHTPPKTVTDHSEFWDPQFMEKRKELG